ncbi:MAG: TRAP transporter fused permease subunit [Pseudomonadota bacterium]
MSTQPVTASEDQVTPAPKDDPENPGGFHQLGSLHQKLVFGLAVAVSVIHIYINFIGTFPLVTASAIHFGSLGLLCALTVPMLTMKGKSARWLMFGVDALIGAVAVAACVYIVMNEDAVARRGYRLETGDWVAAIVAILCVLEFTRRTTGWIIPIMSAIALTYITVWGDDIDGVFRFAGMTWETTLQRTIYNDEGIFGIIANISVTVVFMFILFGAFLMRSGAGDAVIDLSRAVVGRLIGGPGFVAVFSSGLMGTISGSAAANTSSTGVITIPLMRQAGFPPKFAAGTEAASSTGGQLMPPIMGAGVFVMASFTQIPYTHIIVVAFLPAVLYFLSIAFWVRIEAKKLNLKPDLDAPPIMEVMKRGGITFVVPLTILIGMLVMGYTPVYAAPFAIVATIVTSWLTPTKMGPKAILEAMAQGARNMILVGMLLVSVGIVVNVIATAGIGPTLSQMIKEWSGGNLMVALVLIALASLVLGMGLPVTASYIVLGTISAPALYDLMISSNVVDAVASGQIPESAKAFLILVAPERIAEIGLPMSRESAEALIALMGPDVQQSFQQAMVTGLDAALVTGTLLSAHMIIFWLSQDSNVTPPVCLTAFIAAAIAKTPPMATGFVAWKVAKGLYFVPLLFAYTPFLHGEWMTAVQIFAFGTVGIYAMSGAIAGFMEHAVPHILRLPLFIAGFVMLVPIDAVLPLGHWWEIIGLSVFVLIFGVSVIKGRKAVAAG